jgi:4-amino-4-deoxy-L-arabinose transferase-like glycosyltransferase
VEACKKLARRAAASRDTTRMGMASVTTQREPTTDVMARPVLAVLVVTTCVAAVYFSWGVNSWRFSFVGDEWAFYSFAKQIVSQHLLVYPLDANGVYSSNPVLGSFYQAIFIAVLGPSNFAWRLSNTVLIVPISAFFFLWLNRLFNSHVALAGTIILQSSFYLANFFKVGYTNPQAVALLVICLYLATTCAFEPSYKHMSLLGITLGLSFYIYIGPLFPLIVWPFLVPIIGRDGRRGAFPKIATLGVIYVALIVPGFLNLAHVTAAAHKTVLQPEFHDRLHILVNMFNGFLAFYQVGASDHFVTNPCLDIVSRVLALVGTMVALRNIRQRKYLLFLAVYACAVVVIFGTSPYVDNPTTRTICVVPFGAAFAGLGLGAIRVVHRWYLLGPILAMIFGLNLHQSQIGVFEAMGSNPTQLILQQLQQARASKPIYRTVLVLSNQNRFNYENVLVMQQAYGLETVSFDVVPVSQLQCTAIAHSHVLVLASDTRADLAVHTANCPARTGFTVTAL